MLGNAPTDVTYAKQRVKTVAVPRTMQVDRRVAHRKSTYQNQLRIVITIFEAEILPSALAVAPLYKGDQICVKDLSRNTNMYSL